MYSTLLIQGLRGSGVKLYSLKDGVSLHSNVCLKTKLFQRHFATTRSRFCKNTEKVKTDKTTSKGVPKVSELKRLFKAAYPERWKIAGNVTVCSTLGHTNYRKPPETTGNTGNPLFFIFFTLTIRTKYIAVII